MAERSDGDRAVLFDVDGTLVDSNYLHVQAWAEALAEVGRPSPAWKVHRSIGMDSTKLLERLLGSDADALGQRASELHAEKFQDLADKIQPFECARALLRAVHAREILVVLATSAPKDELARLRRALDCDDAISAVTSSADVQDAKPSPEVIDVALDKIGIAAEQAVLVGDAVWDAKAAARAGVKFVGLRCGGIAADDLRRAGATAIYDDPCDLLHGLDDSALIRGG